MDDFTTAARIEADKRMRGGGLVSSADMTQARGFLAGAVWAREAHSSYVTYPGILSTLDSLIEDLGDEEETP